MAEVRLTGVTKSFGKTVAIRDVDLAVADGEFVVLLGPTGAGKTTTLRTVAGLERPETGTVHIGGKDVTRSAPAERDVAFVFQQYSLYPHLTVFENMAFPLRSPARRVPEDRITERVGQVAEMLRIDHKLANKATRLSGGEMQRVAIGRALVRDPSIFLMDEPLSSLDAKLRAGLRVELKRIQYELGATILYVTHDQIEAMTLATRVGVLNQGRLVQIGTPKQIYEDPDDIYVAGRLGSPRINLVPAGVIAVPAPPGTATVGLRTEHVEIGRDGTPATIDRIEHLGDQSRAHMTVAGTPFTVLVDAHTDLAPGDSVGLSPRAPLFFDAAGTRIRA